MTGRIAMMLPWLLIAGGTFIIQYHSMEFWSVNVNQSIGWVWSVVIEAGSLWLWYRPGIASRALGLAASLLLLAGPLYQIGGVAVKADAQARASAAHHALQLAQYREKVAQYKGQLKSDKDTVRVGRAENAHAAQTAHARLAQDARLVRAYMENSRKRVGWLPAIQKLQKRMDREQGRIDVLNKQAMRRINIPHRTPPNPPVSVANKGVSVILLVLLQALGLMLIQLTNILAITHISRNMRTRSISAPYMRGCADNAHLCANDTKIPESNADNHASENVTAQLTAHQPRTLCADLRGLAQEVRDWMEREGVSIAGASLNFGVSRQNLSCLLRWEEPGDRKPSGKAMEKVRVEMEQKQEIAL